MRFKPCDLDECSRDYLEDLLDQLREAAARGERVDPDWMAKVAAAAEDAPPYFIVHAYS